MLRLQLFHMKNLFKTCRLSKEYNLIYLITVVCVCVWLGGLVLAAYRGPKNVFNQQSEDILVGPHFIKGLFEG